MTYETRAAELLLPRSNMAGLIFAAIVRDTRNIALRAEARTNYFPATPLCAVSWVFAGDLYLIDPETGAPAKNPLPKLFISGPKSTPTASWSPGPIFAMTVGVYPDRWSRLSGRPVREISEQIEELDSLSPELAAALRAPVAGQTARERFERLQTALRPLEEAEASGFEFAPHLSCWLRALTARAALSGAGRSARQLQRRIRDWTGQSRRALELHARVENVFAQSRAHSSVNLAELAAETGYADQSHMGREVKRITGRSPAHINQLIAENESYWCYRLLGERL